jgi:tripartite-type tricarboxylate transporter receptor subunit TctC
MIRSRPDPERRNLLGALAFFAVTPAFASSGFPSRPIRVITPATGGTLDLVARSSLEAAGRVLGQPVLLEPRPGANGMLAARAVTSAPADGHTLLLMAVSALAINPSVYKNVGYDTERDLAPVSLLAKTLGVVLVVNPKLSVHTLAEFIAYCRTAPSRVDYASAGIGNLGHLAMEVFTRKAGIRLTHVPYKSATANVNAVITNEVQAAFIAGPPVLPFGQSGQVRALAVTGSDRLREMPDVPTFREAGVDGVDLGGGVGLFAPGATPPDILQALNKAIVEAQRKPEVIKASAGIMGYELQSSTPQQLGQLLSGEVKRFAEIVRLAGITPN